METREELTDLPVKELVGIHNSLVDTEDQIGSWKKGKGGLVDKIIGLREEVLERRADTSEPDAAEEPEAAPDEPEAAPSDATPEKTIKARSLELLCEVDYHEDRNAKPGSTKVEPSAPGARTVGLPYDAILDQIKEEFPGCETSLECLRWYAVKVRGGQKGYEGLRLPQRRPRATAKKQGD